MTKRRDLVELLSAVPIFQRCSRRELKAVARHAETVELDAGEQLMAEGAPGDALFVLVEGRADVVRGGETVGTIEPGGYVGELALLDGEPRSASVVAASPVVAAVLGTRMFRTLVREFPELADQLLAGLAAQLREARSVSGGSAPDVLANGG